MADQAGVVSPDDVLVVGAGDTVRVLPPTDGLEVEAAIDGGPLRPVPGSIVSPSQAGAHWLTVASRNQGGVLSPTRWIRLLVDDQGPETKLEVTPPPVTDSTGTAWVPPRAQARAWATDRPAGVSWIALVVNGVRSQHEGAETMLTLPEEGTVALVVEAADVVANHTRRMPLELRVDRQGPTGSIRVEGPQAETDRGLVLGPTARLIAEIEDTESGVETWTALAGGEPVPHEQWLGQWPVGGQVAAATARDRVGNEHTLKSLSFEVDEQGPTLSWQVTEGATNDAGEHYHRSPVTVIVEADDPVAGVALIERQSAGTWVGVSERMVVEGTSLELRATDRVGNQSTERGSWLVDDVPPTVTLRDPQGKIVPPGTVASARAGQELTVEVADSGVGVATSTYRLNHLAVPGRPLMSPLEGGQVMIEVSGNHVLLVETHDRLGHRTVASWRIEVAKRR